MEEEKQACEQENSAYEYEKQAYEPYKKGGNAEEKKMNVVGRGKMRLTSENQDEPRNNTACHASQCLTPSALSVGLRRET